MASVLDERLMTARILCIEDEVDIRHVLVEELSDLGYDTIEAGDGEAGLDAIVQQRPDLVLCDISMPKMNGHVLLEELRSKHPDLADLPFIFLSALADREHVLAGKRLGVDDYLTKPIDFELLSATIDARLSQVTRMKARKESQMIKLYKAMQCAPESRDDSASGTRSMPSPEGQAVEAPQAVARPAEAASPSSTGQRIASLAGQSNDTVVAGRMQVIGLEAVKEHLGTKWEKHAERVRQIAIATIKRRLTAEDVFESGPDSSFLICFGKLNEADATFKAQSIGREIQERILGSDAIAPCVKENCSISSDVHEVAVTQSELASSDSVVDLLMSRITQAAERAREREQKTMEQIIDSCSIVTTRVTAAKGSKAPLVIADVDKDTQSQLAALRRARPCSENLAADVDALMLGRTTELLCDRAEEDLPMILVDVEFSTLANRPLLERYLTFFAALPKAAKSRLALNLRRLPNDYPSAKIKLLLNSMRRNCRFVTLEILDPSLGNIEVDTLQLPFLTCDYQSLGSRVEKQSGGFKRLIAALHAQKTRLLVIGVPGQNEAAQLFHQGADFVACRT